MNLQPYYKNDIKYIDEVVLQHESEIREFLLYILKEQEIHKILEIGTFEGGTAYIWAQLVEQYKDGKVICIDPCFTPENGHPAEPSRRNGLIYKGKSCESKIIEIQGYSYEKEVQKLTSLLINKIGKVDLLFHDGDHHYDAVKFDIETYSKFIKPGGWIAICDWMDETHGVSKYWKELKSQYKDVYEFVIQKMSVNQQKSHRWLGFFNGVGLIRMPK
jgi:cephalosporin hydroxylase